MYFVNGYIRAQIATEGGLNENGDPIKFESEWSDKIPCNIETNQHANNGKVNGNTFEMATYEVLIDIQSFTASLVKLERHGVDLGEFQVQDIVPFIEVGTIKITV